jgi:hypothetical protein
LAKYDATQAMGRAPKTLEIRVDIFRIKYTVGIMGHQDHALLP